MGIISMLLVHIEYVLVSSAHPQLLAPNTPLPPFPEPRRGKKVAAGFSNVLIAPFAIV